ncbi:hypothetical protein ACFSJU_00595 [Paradesertivirga mongoliensis]|uniref:Uncharacterized protein n=1 Tax=Paradesertivirga mongoliensis TaxID=2100740 RepID=A0ABW4ZFR5_9SPHI|nr:hypothetical protein [Pedobacter mongoliensis]
MKKITLKALLKSARTSVRKSLQSELASVLETRVADQEQSSKKLRKEIEKGAKKLAKKVSNKLEYNRQTLLAMNTEIEVTAINGPAKEDSNGSKQPASQKVKTGIAVSRGSKVGKTDNAKVNHLESTSNKGTIPGPPPLQKRPVKAKISTTTPVVRSPKAKTEETATSVVPVPEQ